MSDTSQAPPPNEWTLLFFIAGDNDLSPLMISELKSIKAAGYQRNTTVLVHFDPQEARIRTKVFNVNNRAKIKDLKSKRGAVGGDAGTLIGDVDDPTIRHLSDDADEDFHKGGKRPEGPKPGKDPDPTTQKEEEAPPWAGRRGVARALSRFLHTAVDKHPAHHYMLFLVGHGMIVGSDTFLPDEHPVSALSLKGLETILREFAGKVQAQGSVFELLGLHSCSMSSVEVVCQLQGTARYMMASQGTSYVGSWPYRKMLIRIFNAVEDGQANTPEEVRVLLDKLFHMSLDSGDDFSYAGYSSDLSLCSLDEARVKDIGKLKDLVAQLKRGLKSKDKLVKERVEDIVLLAHWKAQSYWQENYTDLYDFCKCLREKCGATPDEQAIYEACKKVEGVLAAGDDKLVLRSRPGGPRYQYSRGLSIYFPWSRPIEPGDEGVDDEEEEATEPESRAVAETDDEGQGAMGRYEKYRFKEALDPHSWFSFLNVYFNETLRDKRTVEDGEVEEGETAPPGGAQAASARQDFTAGRDFRAIQRTFYPAGPLSGGINIDHSLFGSRPGALEKSGSAMEKAGSAMEKSGSAVGAACSCPSIKNYPLFDDQKKAPRAKGKTAVPGKRPAKASKKTSKRKQ